MTTLLIPLVTHVDLSDKGIMYRIFLSILIVFLSWGCRPKDKSKGILTESEMVNVLIQLYLAEEKIALFPISYDSLSRLMPYFREHIFTQVGVQDSVFRKSMEYYMAHPKRLEYIYTAVVDSLSLQEQVVPNEYTQYAPPK